MEKSNVLLIGPTGCGKTRIVEATAESLVGNPRSLIKIDCAEFQHSHEIAKLIGSPPGYLGHRETHPLLSQEVLDQYQTPENQISFVLFDEIEKASDALWNLLLGILDKATLTLGDNRKVDFSRAMIFMTSNLGSVEIGTILNPRMGFGIQTATSPPKILDEKLTAKIARAGNEIGVMLAISLHGVDNQTRDKLVPLNRKYPIEVLLEACRNYPRLTNAKRITFEYVMLKGINDSLSDARKLVQLVRGIPAKINLIPFNPWPGSPYECSDWETIERFADVVARAGYASPVRTPRGRDIMAACGQLKSATEKPGARAARAGRT